MCVLIYVNMPGYVCIYIYTPVHVVFVDIYRHTGICSLS